MNNPNLLLAAAVACAALAPFAAAGPNAAPASLLPPASVPSKVEPISRSALPLPQASAKARPDAGRPTVRGAASGAASPAAAASDEELLAQAASYLEQSAGDYVLEQFGSRLQELARNDPQAMRLLAQAYFYAHRFEDLRRHVAGTGEFSPVMPPLLRADVAWWGGAYPLAAKLNRGLQRDYGQVPYIKQYTEHKLSVLQEYGLDAWTAVSQRELGDGASLVSYRNDRSEGKNGQRKNMYVQTDGGELDAVYSVTQGKDGTLTLSGQVGGDGLDLFVNEAGASEKTFWDRIQNAAAEHRSLFLDYHSAWRSSVKNAPFTTAALIGAFTARAGGLSAANGVDYGGLHFPIAALFLSLEMRTPKTVMGQQALRHASRELFAAEAYYPGAPAFLDRKASLYWRAAAYGLAAENHKAYLAADAETPAEKRLGSEISEVGTLLEATQHAAWESAKDVSAGKGLPSQFQVDLYRNKAPRSGQEGLIVHELELQLYRNGRYIGTLALAGQTLKGTRYYFLDVLGWGARSPLLAYGATRPAESKFLEQAFVYLTNTLRHAK